MSPTPGSFAHVCFDEICPKQDESEEEKECTQGLNMLMFGLPPRVLRRRLLRRAASPMPCRHADTVLIFDWDDTLLCTSALNSCTPAQLIELEQLAESTLELAMSFGTTLIVTNANEGWVQQSAGSYMPHLLAGTLQRVPVVSAREVHEHLFPDDPLGWKRETFCKLLRRKIGSELNLIVLGDSFAEIGAADVVGEMLDTCLVKTVKFKSSPSPSELLSELHLISGELGKLVAENRSISTALVQHTASCRPQEASCHWSLCDVTPRCARPGLMRLRRSSGRKASRRLS